MHGPSSLSSPFDELQTVTSDSSASSESKRGALEDALQHALTYSLDAKVQAHLSVILE
jgi:hypothetical protein